MTRLLVRRILWGLVTLFLFQSLMFFVINILVPGDWVTQFSMFLSEEQRQQMREELGLNLPLWQQYLNWLRSFAEGKLGRSMSGSTVADILVRVMPPTLMVFVPGTVIAFLLGQWLGKSVAWKPGPISNVTTLTSIVLYTSFPSWLAFLAIYFLGRRMRLFRDSILPQQSTLLWHHAEVPSYRIIWYMILAMVVLAALFYGIHLLLKRFWKRKLPWPIAVPLFLAGWVGSWQLLGFFQYAFDAICYFALPTLVFIALSFGETALIMRTNMMDTLQEQYITTARAKGVPEKLVRDKHAARNALLPVMSRLVISLPYLLTGLVIIEHSFSMAVQGVGLRGIQISTINFQGMGWAFFMALTFQDIPVVMGTLFVVGLMAIIARVVIDMLQAYFDPRIRHQGRA